MITLGNIPLLQETALFGIWSCSGLLRNNTGKNLSEVGDRLPTGCKG